MSWTTTAPSGASASSRRISSKTRGWMIPSSRRRASSSPNTRRATACRSIAPSSVRTPGPNSATTSASPGVPGATTSRASRSASITTAPSSRRIPETVLFPDAIPPVSPTRIPCPLLWPAVGTGCEYPRMSLTQYFVAASADGFIATEDDDLEWLVSLDSGAAGPDTDNPYDSFMGEVGAVAMGSATYEWVLEHDAGPWGFSQPCWV